MNARKNNQNEIRLDLGDMLDDIDLERIVIVSREKAQEIAHELCSAAIAIVKSIDGEVNYTIHSQCGESDVCAFMNVHTHEIQERRMEKPKCETHDINMTPGR